MCVLCEKPAALRKRGTHAFRTVAVHFLHIPESTKKDPN